MIKVNLLKNRVGAETQAAGSSGLYSAGGDEGSMVRSAIVKLLVLFLSTGALMLFESQNLSQLNEKYSTLTVQNQQIDASIAEKNGEAENVKNIEQEAKELEDKLKLFNNLSRLRLREVKTLDVLQKEIPERVWLKSLNYEGDRFEVTGGAMSTSYLTEFVKKLEESAYMRNVIVIRDQKMVAGSGSISYREFQFKATSE